MPLVNSSGGAPAVTVGISSVSVSGISSVNVVGIASVSLVGSFNIAGPVGYQVGANSLSVALATDPDLRPVSGVLTTADINSSNFKGMLNIGISSNAPTAGSSYSISVNGNSTTTIQVSGAWSGTLSIDVSYDGGTFWYTNFPCKLKGTTQTLYTITGNGVFQVNSSNCTQVSIRAVTLTSGTPTCQAEACLEAGVVDLAQATQGAVMVNAPSNFNTTNWDNITGNLPFNPRAIWTGVATGAVCSIKMSGPGITSTLFTNIVNGWWNIPVAGISTIYNTGISTGLSSQCVVIG